MKILSGRVLIKKLDGATKSKAGLTIKEDKDALPKAEIVLVAEDVKDRVKIGNIVYYMEAREKGECKYNEEKHYIIPIGNVIAIL